MIWRLLVKNNIYIFFLFFLITRIIFINSEAVFFDSQQYLLRLANGNFQQSVLSGHVPLHAGYILVSWPIFHIGEFIKVNPAYLVILAQILLAGLGLFCYFKTIQIIFNRMLAMRSLIIASLAPVFWITNSTIMMETAYISFFLISLYFLTKYAVTKGSKQSPRFLILSMLFLSLSYLTHILIVLWIPMMVYITYLLNKKSATVAFVSITFTVIASGLFNGYLVALSVNTDFFGGLLFLYGSKLREHTHLSFEYITLIRILRNTLIPVISNTTYLVAALSAVSLINLFLKNKKIFLLALFWVLPIITASQWWDPLLVGRHSIIALFGLAMLTAYLMKKKFLYILLIIYILTVSIPALILLREKIPYLELSKATTKLPASGLLIESHYAKPYVENLYQGQAFYVNEPLSKVDLAEEIRKNLKNKKPVFVSSLALSEPYAFYSGPYLNSLSLSYRREFELKSIIEKFTLEEYKIVSANDNLIFYRIVSDIPSAYPKIKKMDYNRRRIDFYDPFFQIWSKLSLDKYASHVFK